MFVHTTQTQTPHRLDLLLPDKNKARILIARVCQSRSELTFWTTAKKKKVRIYPYVPYVHFPRGRMTWWLFAFVCVIVYKHIEGGWQWHGYTRRQRDAKVNVPLNLESNAFDALLYYRGTRWTCTHTAYIICTRWGSVSRHLPNPSRKFHTYDEWTPGLMIYFPLRYARPKMCSILLVSVLYSWLSIVFVQFYLSRCKAVFAPIHSLTFTVVTLINSTITILRLFF